MTDEEAIVYLSTLRQIGRWSAEIMLLLLIEKYMAYSNLSYSTISINYKKKYLPPKFC